MSQEESQLSGAGWPSGLDAGLSSCDLQVAGSIPVPLGHVTLPTTGASVTEVQIYMAVNEMLVQYTGLWSEIGRVADPNKNANNYYY